MGPSRFQRLSLQLFITDLILIPSALFLASWLRWVLPFGQDIPLSAVNLPLVVYLMITACWSISLVLSGSYEPQQVLRWYTEASRILMAGILATVVTAGALYFTFR